MFYHAQQCKIALYPTDIQILAIGLQDTADNAAVGNDQHREEDEWQVAHHTSMNALYEGGIWCAALVVQGQRAAKSCR